MKKLLLIAILMLALVITAVACTDDPVEPGTADDTTVETPTETPTAEPEEPEETTAPEDDETTAPDPEETTAPEDGETTAPEDEETTEPETVNPADPVWIIDADGLNEKASDPGASATTVELNENGYISLTAVGADPWFMVAGSLGEMPEYLVIRYRTNTTQNGEIFIGNGAGPTGGESFVFNYNANSEWNLLVFHLPTVAPYMATPNVNYIRYDYFTGGPEAEGGFLEVAYMAFFNTAEYALAYDFEQYPPYVAPSEAGVVNVAFDTFFVNGQDYFNTATTGGVGGKLDEVNNTLTFAANAELLNVSLRGWVGFNQPIASFGYYVDNYRFIYDEFTVDTEGAVKDPGNGGEHASRFEILVPMSELSGGAHKIGFIVKLEDGTVVLLRGEVTIIKIPETVDEAVSLATGHGDPFSGAPNNYFGQRFNIGEKLLKKISITDMATYSDGNVNTWSFKVWQWNTDYETTVAGTPLFSAEGENHPDNSTFDMVIPADKYITGDIYYEITYLTGTGCFTGWTADTVSEGVETYVAGALKDGSYGASIVVGVPADGEAPEVIPDHQLQNPPVYIIKAKDMLMNNASQMTYEKMDGYVHFVPTGGDPNFMLFHRQTGSRYVSIKYRTEHAANIQIFLASTGNSPTDDTVMMEQALIPDGQWHLAIFDTQVLVDRGVYDGSTAAYLRLDVMEAGYECDDNGEPIRDPNGAWHKLPLPDGATIDIAYFAFFETEEKANAFEYAPVVTDKTVYNVGEPIMVSATGSGKDWVGIAQVDATETIRWWYVTDAGEGVSINALDNAAIQNGTGDATGALPAGDYYIVWVPNDQAMNGAAGLCRYPITIVEPEA